MLGTICQSSTYFFFFPLTQHLMSPWQNQNLYSTLLVERYSFFNLLYVRDGVSCLPVPILVLHKVYVLACITQHLLVELAGIRTICQWEEEQPVSNIDVVCATLCSSETKDPSIHALLTLVLGRRIEYFTLSSRCQSQSKLGGRSNLRLVDPNNLDPSKHLGGNISHIKWDRSRSNPFGAVVNDSIAIQIIIVCICAL